MTKKTYHATKKRTYIAIDGGHLRRAFDDGGIAFNAGNIDKFARHCLGRSEELLKILYYDCLPHQYAAGDKAIVHPVTGKPLPQKQKSEQVFAELQQKNLFAVRFGKVIFRDWKFRDGGDINNAKDYSPNFQQKGVDMRIGLDMASIAELRLVERLVLVSGDTDLIPAMKLCRKRGIQVAIVQLPKVRLAADLRAHADIFRTKEWCKGLKTAAGVKDAKGGVGG